MKKVINGIMIIMCICLISSTAYAEDAYEKMVNVTFSEDDIDSDDIKRLYTQDEISIPDKFSLQDEIKEKCNKDLVASNTDNDEIRTIYSIVRAMETNYALKTGKYIDLSEKYVDYMISDDFFTKDMRKVGEFCVAEDVFTMVQMFGCPTEKEIPYREFKKSEYNKIRNANCAVKVNATVRFPDIEDIEDENLRKKWIDIIKIHIMKYGSICFFDTCIVGWDDSYSTEEGYENVGAFIGLDLNDYSYISYEEEDLLRNIYGIIDTSSMDNIIEYTYSDIAYQHLGGEPSIYGEFQTIFGYKFDRKAKEEAFSHCNFATKIADVMLTELKVKVYLNPIDDTFDKDKLIYLGNVSGLGHMGNMSISLQKPIKLTGKSYAIVFQVMDKNVDNWNFSSNMTSKGKERTGKMYVSTDFDKEYMLCNMDIPIYAFTTTKEKMDLVDNNNGIEENANKNENNLNEDGVKNNGDISVLILLMCIGIIIVIAEICVILKIKKSYK